MGIEDYAVSAWERAREKEEIVLQWLWNWRVTNVHSIQHLLQVARSTTYSTITKLLDRELIQEVEIQVGCALILTAKGAAKIRPTINKRDRSMTPLIYPSRVDFQKIQHDLVVGHTMALQTRAGGFKYVQPDPVLRHRGHLWWEGKKVPDAFALINGKRYVVEVEENSKKSIDDFDREISLYGGDWNRHASGDILDKLVYVSTNPLVLNRVAEAKERAGYYAWVQDANRRWYLADDLPDPYREKFREHIQLIDMSEERGKYYSRRNKKSPIIISLG